MEKYFLKLDRRDLKNLKEFGLPISNSLILVMRKGKVEVEEWPGAGGSYFSNKKNEFPGIKGLDVIEITFPNGRKQEAIVPFSYGPFGILEEEDD
jgi:hypothetical protein